jgi:hypothetical protein
MAKIRASCDACGDVELGTADVRVQICTGDRDATYAFRCPLCEVLVVKPAADRTIDLLVAAGVESATWSLPAELDEPRGSGEAISHDDLLDFHEFLADDDLLAASLDSLLGA